MTDPKENEDIELSTDELKSVSGGIVELKGVGHYTQTTTPTLKGNGPEGSGSGMTKDDYKKSILSKNIRPCIHEPI